MHRKALFERKYSFCYCHNRVSLEPSQILQHIEETTRNLPTTLAEDQAIAAKGFSSYTAWVAVMARMRFKEVLATSVRAIQSRLANEPTLKYTTPEVHATHTRGLFKAPCCN